MNPLDMKDTGFAVVDTGRLVVHYADGKPEPRRMADDDQVNFFGRPVAFSPVRLLDRSAFPSGGAGMAGTASDVLKFLETLRAGGLLQPQTRSAMFKVQALTRAQAEGPGWELASAVPFSLTPKRRARRRRLGRCNGTAPMATNGSSTPRMNSPSWR
jgi:Beta-lactamase